MNILIYDNPNEPLTAVLLKNQKKLKLKSLWMKDFIDHAEVYDEFDKNKTKLNWWMPTTGKITNSNRAFVINRVYHLHDEWFKAFHIKDRAYAKNELWAYLTFALNSFPNITERPNFGALAGGCHALTRQWEIIKNAFKHVKTPEFYIGPLDYLPQEWSEEAIYSHPYNYYFWKVNNHDEKQTDSLFVIRKPKGIPVLSFVIEDEVTLFYEDDKPKLDASLEAVVKKLAYDINKLFNYFTSEILFFVDNQNICFGMIHNSPFASSKSKEFESIVLKEITKRLIIKK